MSLLVTSARWSLFDEDEYPGEDAAHPDAIDARGGDSEHGALPGILAADLRDRDVEAIAQPLRDRSHYAAFLLQGLGTVDVELHHGGPDDHKVARVSWIS